MNFRNWSKQHTVGLLIGLATIIIFIPIVLFVLSQTDNREFYTMWLKFKISNAEKTRIISLACISNLIWFHTFLRKEKWNYAYGVIGATILFLFVIVYFKFLA
ncbi:MAG: hypothetical protein ACK5B9_05630 [Flavobacteriia bacterium]|jgi:hypothetical protein